MRTNKLCFNYWAKRNFSTRCHSKSSCAVIKKSHHTLLHDFTERVEEQSKKQDENPGRTEQSGVSNAVASGRCTMPIIPVKVLSGSKVVTCNAFLDPGSNVSFIAESLAEKLHVTGKKTTIILKTLTRENGRGKTDAS